MKKRPLYKNLWAGVCMALCGMNVQAQSIHFSQYYNAPMLVNPANTAMMPDYDYRVGANFRDQWATVPVPYNTSSAFVDLKIPSKKYDDAYNTHSWMGVGAVIFNDVAGDGNLTLTHVQVSAAYHLAMSQKTILSLGLQGGYAQRSVNYDKLTFDSQWDGFSFNGSLPSNEKGGIIKTNYADAGAGLNFVYLPNEDVYIKIGASVANINQPVESFYGNKNQLGMRPGGDVDVIFKAGNSYIFNPSAFFATQKGASEFTYGTLFRAYLAGHDALSTQLILGAFNRYGDAAIGVVGFQWAGLQVMASYDVTISKLAPSNASNGAVEFSIIYQGVYGGFSRVKKSYNCPRFF
jgi:type IX secretion system PorP/SprF family membrane protein